MKGRSTRRARAPRWAATPVLAGVVVTLGVVAGGPAEAVPSYTTTPVVLPTGALTDADGVATTADGSRTYVLDGAAGTVTTLSIGAAPATTPLTGVKDPEGLAIGGPASAPVLYIADTGNNRVVSAPVPTSSTAITVTLVAGGDLAGGAPVNGPAATSPLKAPAGVAWDARTGALYIADTGNNQVEKVVAGTLSVVAGTGSSTPGAQTPGTAVASRLKAPRDVAVDSTTGALYIADTGNGAVAKVVGTELSTALQVAAPASVATDGTTLLVGSGATVVAAPVSGGASTVVATGLTAAEGITVTSTGSAWVADAAASASRVLALTPSGVPAAPLITSTAPTRASKGTALSATFTATGFPRPTWSVVGTPPAGITGLAIGTTSGILTGTPSTAGPVTFTVRATNASGHDDQVVTLTVGSAPATISAKPTATAGQGSATITWAPPTASAVAGEAVTGYVVTPTAGGTAGTPLSVAAGASSTTVTGLKSGTAYTFTVAATNAFGAAAASPASAPVTPYGGLVEPPAGLTRYQGSNRVLTAVSVSQQLFPGAGSARAVVVASSTSYADSLAGARMAAAVGAPLLLTDPLALNPEVAAEVGRVLAVPATTTTTTTPVALAAADAVTTAPKPTATGTVYLLGGTSAVSAAVETSLKAVNSKFTTTRLSGADRYETAVKIAAQTAVDDPVPGAPIYLASGTDYPDGLAVAALASRTGGVVLLTRGDVMPAATLTYLQTYDPNSELLVAVGGPAARASTGHGGERALVGSDRYDTARLVAARFTASSGSGRVRDVGLATGTNWPDALAGAAAMGNLDGPLLLTPPEALSPAVGQALSALSAKGRPTSALVFGGPSVVSTGTAADFAARALG